MSYTYRGTLDPERCPTSVSDPMGWHHRQCSRKHVRDGFCKQHHPDAEKARRAKSIADYEFKAKRASAPYEKIDELQKEVDRLGRELAKAHARLRYEEEGT